MMTNDSNKICASLKGEHYCRSRFIFVVLAVGSVFYDNITVTKVTTKNKFDGLRNDVTMFSTNFVEHSCIIGERLKNKTKAVIKQ